MQSFEDIKKDFLKSLEIARSLPKPNISRDPVIVYSGGAKPAALELYITLLHAGKMATISPASLAGTSILPYRETGSVIVYTLDERDSRAVNVLMASSSLGLESYLIAPRMHPAIEELVDSIGSNRIEVPSENKLTIMMLASLYWRPKLLGAREERVSSEINQLPSAVEWIIEKYRVEINRIMNEGPSEAYYTPLMEAAGLYYSHITRVNAYELEEAKTRKITSPPVILVSSIEEHNYKDILLNIKLKGIKPIQLSLNTDPVTVNIYATLIFALASGRLA